MTRGVVGTGLGLAAVGGGIGIAAALGLSRFVDGLLFGVAATDPVVYVVTPLVFASVALLACWVPARRAARVEPIIALRVR